MCGEPLTGLYRRRGGLRGYVRQMSSIRATAANSPQSTALVAVKNTHRVPYLFFKPSRLLRHFSSLPLLSRLPSLRARSALPGLGPDLIFDCPCQWVRWCFLLHFHLSLLQGLSGVVNSPGCQLSPHCLLGGYILSALQWSQPTGLFGQALDLLTSPAVCF